MDGYSFPLHSENVFPPFDVCFLNWHVFFGFFVFFAFHGVESHSQVFVEVFSNFSKRERYVRELIRWVSWIVFLVGG